jgi:hypothetical protein
MDKLNSPYVQVGTPIPTRARAFARPRPSHTTPLHFDLHLQPLQLITITHNGDALHGFAPTLMQISGFFDHPNSSTQISSIILHQSALR